MQHAFFVLQYVGDTFHLPEVKKPRLWLFIKLLNHLTYV